MPGPSHRLFRAYILSLRKWVCMSNDTTFYWFDYETFGADPARDRPVQFAGLRTDAEFNPIGEPLVVYCKPASDMLPQPESCLITGITPQIAHAKGVPEAEFVRRIYAELAQPGTCAVGYNNIRFDDEFTRYMLFRNFYDPYEREYKNGNSRWDIIDMVRMCYALRPEGIEWPRKEDGMPSFKLQNLSAANNIKHEAAHDALSDVYATIGLAKLIKDRQPKLYEYVLGFRHKQEVSKLLNLRDRQPLLHTSAMFPSVHGCTTVVLPLAPHPTNRNGIVVYDLRYSPDDVLNLSAEELHLRVFTKTDELPTGVERVHLKTVHINKCPVLAPLSTLTDAAAQRLQIDRAQIERHLSKLKNEKLENKLRQMLELQTFEANADPELNLYGAFLNDADRTRSEKIRNMNPQSLATAHFAFDDTRLPELLFRYRARNFPETLTADEQQRWEHYRRERLTNPAGGGGITMQEFEAKLQALGQADLAERDMAVLEDLAEYGAMLQDWAN
jgi:exodeoxyribonuclease-1